jgi:hypothetical protein
VTPLITEEDTMIRHTTLKEMVEAMSKYEDDEPFRWYQVAKMAHHGGWHEPVETLVVTMGQIRKELGLSKETEEKIE